MKSYLYLSLLCFFSCASFKQAPQSTAQGVFGRLTYASGNKMPSPDTLPKTRGVGVTRWLYIYELTSVNQVYGAAPMYSDIRTNRIATIKSDSLGNFYCPLSPGKYSLFVREGNNFFANQTDSQGAIAAFEVKTGLFTQHDIRINHKAFY